MRARAWLLGIAVLSLAGAVQADNSVCRKPPPAGPIGALCREVAALQTELATAQGTIATLQSELAGCSADACPEGQYPGICCAESDNFCPAAGCVDFTSDSQHCGACGNACVGPLTCVDGACALYCASDGPDPVCAPRGDACDGSSHTCGCGGAELCPRGWACEDGACIRCGGDAAAAGDSCLDLQQRCGPLDSGLYWIAPDGMPAFEAYCDMTTDGGGWTLLGTQIANMSEQSCYESWSVTATGTFSLAPLPNSDSGVTTRFPFDAWNALSAAHPEGAYKATSSAADTYVSYWSAACYIFDWDSGTPECFYDYADYALTQQRRESSHSHEHGVLQAYSGNDGYSDVMLAYTSFQACWWTPAVGFMDGAGNFSGYAHDVGLMIWFR